MCEHCTYVNNPGVSVCAMCCRTSANSTIGEDEARARAKKKDEEKREKAAAANSSSKRSSNKATRRSSSRYVVQQKAMEKTAFLLKMCMFL